MICHSHRQLSQAILYTLSLLSVHIHGSLLASNNSFSLSGKLFLTLTIPHLKTLTSATVERVPVHRLGRSIWNCIGNQNGSVMCIHFHGYIRSGFLDFQLVFLLATFTATVPMPCCATVTAGWLVYFASIAVFVCEDSKKHRTNVRGDKNQCTFRNDDEFWSLINDKLHVYILLYMH